MHRVVQPNAWVVVRLPSDTARVVEIVPNTAVSLGRYGTFPANRVIGRPYHLTYELLDRQPGQKDSDLRIVPAIELHADTIAEEEAAQKSGSPGDASVAWAGDGVEFQLVGDEGEIIMRSNRETIDDSARQTLTMEEIEELKRGGAGAGKDLIARLMLSHSGISEKTSFSLAKYKVLKEKKFLRRFTILPMDVGTLTHWLIEQKDATKILEIREEMLALAGSCANIHHTQSQTGGDANAGRWLVVDETGGLVVAAIAERMGILHPSGSNEPSVKTLLQDDSDHKYGENTVPATFNTITLIHNNAQPNLSLLKYFHYDPHGSLLTTPTPSHPLSSHLQSISWLQLLSPELDITYSTPPPSYTAEELASFKSNKRGTYYRKLRRHIRTRQVIDTTRHGSFDGLVIASSMTPESILRNTVHLLRGGAQITVYGPSIEPLTHLADLYSTSRRTAFIQSPPPEFDMLSADEQPAWSGNEDFPLNPTLVLSAGIQTARIRKWQVLPGRTHPFMTGRGGAEGYLWTGTRVIPAEGRVEARGKFNRKRKGDEIDKAEEGMDEKKVKTEEDIDDKSHVLPSRDSMEGISP